MDRYVTGSDSGGLVMGQYDTKTLPVYANGMPTNYPFYASPLATAVRDNALTASCNPPAGRPATPGNVECGSFAVNTIQPFYQPYSPGTADARRLPPLDALRDESEFIQAAQDSKKTCQLRSVSFGVRDGQVADLSSVFAAKAVKAR